MLSQRSSSRASDWNRRPHAERPHLARAKKKERRGGKAGEIKKHRLLTRRINQVEFTAMVHHLRILLELMYERCDLRV
jgi:hypothetical protein